MTETLTREKIWPQIPLLKLAGKIFKHIKWSIIQRFQPFITILL